MVWGSSPPLHCYLEPKLCGRKSERRLHNQTLTQKERKQRPEAIPGRRKGFMNKLTEQTVRRGARGHLGKVRFKKKTTTKVRFNWARPGWCGSVDWVSASVTEERLFVFFKYFNEASIGSSVQIISHSTWYGEGLYGWLPVLLWLDFTLHWPLVPRAPNLS